MIVKSNGVNNLMFSTMGHMHFRMFTSTIEYNEKVLIWNWTNMAKGRSLTCFLKWNPCSFWPKSCESIIGKWPSFAFNII